MKKLSFCALALTLTALFFSGSALAGDVPSCPMIGWGRCGRSPNNGIGKALQVAASRMA